MPTAFPVPYSNTSEHDGHSNQEYQGILSSNTDWMAATNCEPGTYGFMNSGNNAKFCTYCPAGKYKNKMEWVNCKDCPSDHSSTQGSTKCYRTPTPAPTPMPTPRYSMCQNGDETVPSGWWGKGAGNNYCNLCKCNEASAPSLTCTQKVCGIPTDLGDKRECSHTTCSYSSTHPCYSIARNELTGVHTCQSKTLATPAMFVSHHTKEEHGANHDCHYEKHSETSGTCKCFCYGGTNSTIATTAS